MEKDILTKIQKVVSQGSRVTEDQVRSLLILVRKQLELHPMSKTSKYFTLNLFCNWAAHTEITQSLTGLKILGRINDVLVKVKTSSVEEVRIEISRTIGFDTLYDEFTLFLQKFGLTHQYSDKRVWDVFLAHLIEIIRDVPLTFPPIQKLPKAAKKIYDRIIHNPIKPGAGVIRMKLSAVDYDKLGAKGYGELLCLLIQTEDKTRIVIPLKF